MSSGEDTHSHELVIIRRRSGEGEEPHKGGVWKIAYADFMTAMMAFFLVMWLINATDEQTLIQVATYFNPLRLTDRVTSTKGVHDPDSGSREKGDASGNSSQKDGKASGAKKSDASNPKYTEETLFKDPYGILTRLAVQAKRSEGDDQTRFSVPVQNDIAEIASRAEAYRDPFEPKFRKEAATKALDGKDELKNADRGATAAQPEIGVREIPAMDPSAGPTAANAAAEGEATSARSTQKTAREAAEQAAREAEQADRAKLEGEIRQTLQQSALGLVPNIDVTVTEEGLLVSLTDRFDFGMFRISSAEPRPELVVVMERLAKVLAARPESLIVRGHTDGRPFKSGTYDNWRLSTARAHMAYYMLVRGGIAERRFERIQGHADRSLKIADDPGAAQNRRIEILLRKATP
jgi:chemotaxis protein MotB